MVVCVGSGLAAAVPDTWTGEGLWGEDDKIMKEEFFQWGTAGEERVNAMDAEERPTAWNRPRRAREAVWDKMVMKTWLSMTKFSLPSDDGDKQTTKEAFLSWAEMWKEEGVFLASEGSSSKTIKFGPIKNCCKLWMCRV